MSWLPHTLPWKILALALLAGVTMGQASATGSWKWRDASGRITVSDLPPPKEVPEKDILERPDAARRRATAPAPAASPAAATPAAAASAVADPRALARQRDAEREAQARARADEARLATQRAENCQRAREQLKMLESGERLMQYNEKGERVVMDDARRSSELRRVREIIASECR